MLVTVHSARPAILTRNAQLSFPGSLGLHSALEIFRKELGEMDFEAIWKFPLVTFANGSTLTVSLLVMALGIFWLCDRGGRWHAEA